MNSLEEKRELEKRFWKNDPEERPGVESLINLINKFGQVNVLTKVLQDVSSYELFNGSARDVLEIGGGQGWASCVIKKLNPHLKIVSSDLSGDATASQVLWQRVFGVQLEESVSCPSDSLPCADNSIDVIFTFAAAHHFITHEATICECARVLRPGGRLVYFYEPVTPKFWYSLAKWRVNRKRPIVPEDLLIPKELRSYAEKYGLSFDLQYFPDPVGRGLVEKLYYSIQRVFPILCRLFPSTATVVMSKPS